MGPLHTGGPFRHEKTHSAGPAARLFRHPSAYVRLRCGGGPHPGGGLLRGGRLSGGGGGRAGGAAGGVPPLAVRQPVFRRGGGGGAGRAAGSGSPGGRGRGEPGPAVRARLRRRGGRGALVRRRTGADGGGGPLAGGRHRGRHGHRRAGQRLQHRPRGLRRRLPDPLPRRRSGGHRRLCPKGYGGPVCLGADSLRLRLLPPGRRCLRRQRPRHPRSRPGRRVCPPGGWDCPHPGRGPGGADSGHEDFSGRARRRGG